MKPEGRSSFINRSFRRSFRRKKADNDEKKSPEEIQAEKDKALIELKKAFRGVKLNSHAEDFFERALKARCYDVAEAEKLVRLFVNCLNFLQVDQFLPETDVPEVIKNHGMGGVLGFDKRGYLVRLINLGRLDLKGFIHCVSLVEILTIFIYYIQSDIEKTKEENKKTGRKNVNQMVYIIDMDNFSTNTVLYKPVVDSVLATLKLHRDFFCDITKDVFIVNAGSFYSNILKVFKPAMHDCLKNNITVLEDDWREVLLQHIDADVLPKHLGGNRVDKNADPKCSEFIAFGGEIPTSYYFQPDKFFDDKDPNVKVVNIAAGSFVNIPIIVKDTRVKVQYEILSKDHDLGLTMFFNDLDADEPKDVFTLEQIAPLFRAQCSIRPISGCFRPWKSGNYILHFDNTYSWMVPKQIFYKISTLPLAK